MFYVYHSNALDVLKALLVRTIEQAPLDDPFASEQILVQSPGMAQWLKLELAEAQGIAAAVDFPLPASYLWRNFADLLPDVPELSAFDKEAMTWRIMAVLPECLSLAEFSPLAGYLKADDESDNEDQLDYRRYQLASRIADTFDQYLVYRPNWIEGWDRGGDIAAQTQPWQPILWRKLVAKTEALSLSPWHRGNMMSAFIEKALTRKISKRLFVFGISALPQHYLDALAAIAQHTDVHLFVTNPCNSYWGDIVDAKFLAKIDERWLAKLDRDAIVQAETDYNKHHALSDQASPTDLYDIGNPLLASLGKLGRDYLVQLQAMPVREIDAFADIDRDCLLHHIQSDILNLVNPNEGLAPHIIADDDGSIRFHSCHSPMRELEVLHDQLLALFDSDDQNLLPKDIIVMMSDVASYAPYIDAVFGQADSQHYIPYSIADKSLQQESPILNSFMSFLYLSRSRLEVADVLELLEVPAILAKLGLDEISFKRIRHWVLDANVRWGLSGAQRGQWQIPEFEQNSWLFGLRRMLAGYALGAQAEPWLGIAGYSDIEGLEANDLGALARFIELLCQCCENFVGEASLELWQTRVNQLLDAAYLAEAHDEYALEQVRKAMAQLQRVYAESGMAQEIPVEILIDFIKTRLTGESSGRGFMVGAVNFCTLMPMRSIPFKVVCLLGMNDGSYPRSMPPLGFDLIAEHPQRGDRSRRDDDRYLFLEALLSAQDYLYISYLGHSVQDNSEKVASVLVSELTEYIDQGYCLTSGESLSHWLVTDHALVPFSQRYFTEAHLPSTSTGYHPDGYFSYAQDWLNALVQVSAETNTTATAHQPLPPIELDIQLDVDVLIRFFKAPIRQFFNQRLNVHFDSSLDGAIDLTGDDTDSAEPFVIDNLDNYQLNDRYLDTALMVYDSVPSADIAIMDTHVAAAFERLDQHISHEGVLPVSVVASQKQSQVKRDMAELAATIYQSMDGERTRKEINVSLTVDNLLVSGQKSQLDLVGWQDHWYGECLLKYRPAKAKGADYFSAWISHLAACASGLAVAETRYFGTDKAFRFKPLPQEIAQQQLAGLVSIYQYGLSWPLPLDMNVAWASWEAYQKVLEKLQSDDDSAKQKALTAAFKAVDAAVKDSPYRPGLETNPYFSKALEQGCFADSLSRAVEQDQSGFGPRQQPWVECLIVPMCRWLEPLETEGAEK